jgi:hypothetical protein
MAWICPYCRHPQIVGNANFSEGAGSLSIGENEFDTRLGYKIYAVACLNSDCQRVTLNLRLSRRVSEDGYQLNLGHTIQDWTLLPESAAKPQPNYIPKGIQADYVEACRIKDLSPKASATLARRCLQGMIRDFTGIAKNRLIDELAALRDAVDKGHAPAGVTPESVDGIDSVREIGNIGAHMEKDVDLIVDIEPGEAKVLIELIEVLFEEWYVARHIRQERFARVAAVSAEKRLALEKAKGAKLAAESSGDIPPVAPSAPEDQT